MNDYIIIIRYMYMESLNFSQSSAQYNIQLWIGYKCSPEYKISDIDDICTKQEEDLFRIAPSYTQHGNRFIREST